MRDRAKKLCMKLLAAVMVITMMIPVTAFAQDDEAGISEQANDPVTVGLNWTSGAKEVVAGETYSYEITVTNNTEDTLEGAEVSTTFLAPNGYNWNYGLTLTLNGTNESSMIIDSIAAGETVTIDATVTFPLEAARQDEETGNWQYWGWMRGSVAVDGHTYEVNGWDQTHNHSFKVVAPEEEAEPQEPVISISGLPDMLYAGQSGTFTVNVDYAGDMTGWYIEVSGLGNDSTRYDLSDGKAEVGYTLGEDIQTGHQSIWIDLYSSDDGFQGLDLFDVYCTGKLSLTMDWATTKEVVAGKAYPFTLTIQNNTDEVIDDVTVFAYGLWMGVVDEWSADITFDGVVADKDRRTSYKEIGRLEAGETLTLKCTITFPMESVGDATWITVYLEAGGVQYAGATSSNTEVYAMEIVAPNAGTSGNNGSGQGQTDEEDAKTTGTDQKAPQTGDRAPLAGIIVLMMVSAVAGCTVMMKKKEK